MIIKKASFAPTPMPRGLGFTEGDSSRMRICIDGDMLPLNRCGNTISLSPKQSMHRAMGEVVLEKRSNGKLYVNGLELRRYVSAVQCRGERIQGCELLEDVNAMKHIRVPNGCVLDALIENPQLIPDGDEWKHNDTFFLGDIYESEANDLCVACLSCLTGPIGDLRWHWGYLWLNLLLEPTYAVAVLME